MSTNENDFFERAVALLREHAWIYDFQVTELFCQPVMEQRFPLDWQRAMRQLSYDQLDQLVVSDGDTLPLPASLRHLIDEAKSLSKSVHLDQRQQQQQQQQQQQAKTRGLTAKKRYEIEQLAPFVVELSAHHSCKYVLDIGAGLNHLDEALVDSDDALVVIGVERDASLVAEANKRLAQRGLVGRRIVNVCMSLGDESRLELMQAVRRTIDSLESQEEEEEEGDKEPNAKKKCCPIGLVSLHSCGDLTPTMLRLFADESVQASSSLAIGFVAAFSCCYHTMRRVASDASLPDDYVNFPMSAELRLKLRASGLRLNAHAMRLACQQTVSVWRTKKREDHEAHERQVAYRAIVQRYCSDSRFHYIVDLFLF